MKRLRHLDHRPGGPTQEGAEAPETVSTVPNPKAPATHTLKPDSYAVSSNTEHDGRATQKPAAAKKRKRPSYEEASAISDTGRDHAAEKKIRIPRDDSTEIDSQLETSDESQSAKYETAPQFPVPEESQINDDDTLVPLATQEEVGANDNPESLEAWIQKRVDSGRKIDDILQALSCTSMNAELADKVLDLLSEGTKIPRNMQ